MKENNNGFAQILIVVLLVVGLASLGAYRLGVKKAEVSVLPTPPPYLDQTANWKPYTNGEITAVKTLIQNFYAALEKQEGKALFSYMTSPTTSEEKENYNWLTGADLGPDGSYRVFLRIRISKPRINNIQKVNETAYQMMLSDQMWGWSNVDPVGWGAPQERNNILITIVNVDGKWLVDRFTDKSAAYRGNAGTQKYNGFGQ